MWITTSKPLCSNGLHSAEIVDYPLYNLWEDSGRKIWKSGPSAVYTDSAFFQIKF